MASAVIHMAVATEINKILQKDTDKILIGSIAPDISKQIGKTKVESHFLDSETTNIPNIDKFLNKYKDNLNDDFVMGYFIHLYTDYLWFKYFLPEIYNNDNHMITKLDGTVVKCDERMLPKYIYNDYTNINVKLLDEYEMDLHIFYEKIPKIQDIITEIPMEKLYIIINAMSVIIQNTKERKEYVFDITHIKKFVETSTQLLLLKINEVLSEW